MSNRTPYARLAAASTAVAVVVALAIPTAASAAPTAESTVPAAAAEAGWLRLGHFSPDTKEVDIRVSALRGGSIVLELSDVGYGDITPYQSLPSGTYAVSMIPAGTDDWSELALGATISVTAGAAKTAAAYGRNSALKVKLFQDDLTAPAAGNARIRLVQASTITPTVDVETSTGLPIANAARQGSATSYAEVPAGDWTLRLTGVGVEDSVDVNVAAGSVSTLFVLDTADGGLTIVPILDSAAVGLTPVGGVQTGGGWLAEHGSAPAHARTRYV